MYELYYITEINSFEFSQQKYRDSTNWDECIVALQWSIKNPDYNYQKLLPNLRFSNKEIAQYLSHLHKTIGAESSKNRAYPTVTD